MILSLGDLAILALMQIGVIIANSYLKQKGRNYADKEDIKALTNSIEEVKSDFNNKAELLKANLQFSTNKKTSTFDEQRNAIVEYLKRYNTFYSSIQHSPPNIFVDLQASKIESILGKINVSLEELILAEVVFDLFIDDPTILGTKNSLQKQTCEKLYLATYKTFSDIIIELNKQEELGAHFGVDPLPMNLVHLQRKIITLTAEKEALVKGVIEQKHLLYSQCAKFLNPNAE